MKTKLKNNEKVILTVKKHWITLVPVFILGFYLCIFSIKYEMIFLAVIGVLLLLYKYIDRRNNVWIVTNYRVIDEYGVFSINSRETPLDKINNISYRKSIVGRMLGFGSVMIQSAAESGVTTHKLVESPQLLKDTITEYQEKYKESSMGTQFGQIASALKGPIEKSGMNGSSISSEIEKLHELKMKGIISDAEFEQGKKQILSNNK